MKSYIDSHVHCGKVMGYLFENYLESIKETNIETAVMFAPVGEIYERHRNFKDDEEWRQKRKKANEYILTLTENQKLQELKVVPFFFVWNDFSLEKISQYKGIKWHRHSYEPEYEYESERCKKFIKEIQKRNLPVILEEEFNNTLFFINNLAKKVRVIIPHLGLLNGGYESFCQFEIWKKNNIYADTALADSWMIEDYIKKYGYERIMFGSDFPFGSPREELEKILQLNIDEKAKETIIRLNVLKLLNIENL